jgi:hypothetical protein
METTIILKDIIKQTSHVEECLVRAKVLYRIIKNDTEVRLAKAKRLADEKAAWEEAKAALNAVKKAEEVFLTAKEDFRVCKIDLQTAAKVAAINSKVNSVNVTVHAMDSMFEILDLIKDRLKRQNLSLKIVGELVTQ